MHAWRYRARARDTQSRCSDLTFGQLPFSRLLQVSEKLSISGPYENGMSKDGQPFLFLLFT
jgi:hypothetical protein